MNSGISKTQNNKWVWNFKYEIIAKLVGSVKAKVDHESSMFSPQNCQISISPGYDTRYNRKVIKYDSEFNLVKEARSFKENTDVYIRFIFNRRTTKYL